MTFAGFTSSARELTFHGPMLQWHEDPTSRITITWVEEIAPDSKASAFWRRGEAGFGYGDGDDRTILSGMQKHYSRVYLAKSFDLDELPSRSSLELRMRYDDAFVAWINGVEVARSANLTGQHNLAIIRDSHEADQWESFQIPAAQDLLREGSNLIHIEGHNSRSRSSDFSLHPVLKLGEKALIPEKSEWAFLAGMDPERDWITQAPPVSIYGNLPQADESDWVFGYRVRDSDLQLQSGKVEEDEFAKTGNPIFKVTLDSLLPDTSYEFSLFADNREVHAGWFLTAPAVLKNPMRFVAGGDMGTKDAISACRLAGEEDPQFALVGGDLAYANGIDAGKWYDWLDNWSQYLVSPGGRAIPIVAGIGNHEMRRLRSSKKGAPFYFSLFDLPRGDSNFTVDIGNYLSITLLDSNHAQKVEDQTRWLERQLVKRQEIPHLFAAYHRPAWGTGVKENIKEIQEEWCPLFERFGVDCVFENDHHTYKRSHKLLNGRRDDRRGVLYLGDGAWGAETRPILDRHLDREGARNYLAKWDSRHHIIVVTISPDGRKHYQAKSPGEGVFDEYSDVGTPPAVATGVN